MSAAAEVRIPLFQKYDVQVTTDPVFAYFGPDQVGRKPALTSGSSTTVTKVTAGDAPFDGLQVGAELSVNRDGTRDVVYITTFTDNENIVVDTAVNWQTGPQSSSGRHFHYRKFFSGQTDSDGWINKRQFEKITIQWSIPTFNAASITLTVEGRIRGPQTTPVTIYTQSVTAAGEDFITITEEVDEIRFGALVVTDSGTNTLNAYALCTPRAWS